MHSHLPSLSSPKAALPGVEIAATQMTKRTCRYVTSETSTGCLPLNVISFKTNAQQQICIIRQIMLHK